MDVIVPDVVGVKLWPLERVEGVDVAPEPNGTEVNPYYETIVFEALVDVENAESQLLAAVRYLQVVRRNISKLL